MSTSLSATYDNYMLTMRLAHSIGRARFDATQTNYVHRLHARHDMPNSLKRLIAELFHAGAITKCVITFGARMDLELCRTSDAGRMLLSRGALENFQRKFAKIAGREKLATTWRPTGSSRGGRRGEADYNGVAMGFARIFDAVCDGLVVAAAVDQLFGDN